MGSKAGVVDEVVDQEFLLPSVVETDEREDVGMVHPPQPPHVLLEILLADIAHVPISLHHHDLFLRHRGFVTGPEQAAAQDLRRRPQQVSHVEDLPVLSQESDAHVAL